MDKSPWPSENDFTLAALPLGDDLGGTEGLDPNYVSRIRVQYLLGQNHALVTQMQFADAKAAALMTIMGLIALRGPIDVTAMRLIDPLGVTMAGLNALCLAACIWALIPRYPARSVRNALAARDRFSWPALTAPDLGPLDYARFMRQAEVSQLVMSLAQSNAAMSRILLRKFTVLRAAFWLAIANVGVILIAAGLR